MIESIVSRAKESGIFFTLENDKIGLRIPRDRQIDAELLQLLRVNKEAIREFLLQRNNSAKEEGGRPMIPKADRSDRGRLALSFSQERLWFTDQLQGTLEYHLPWMFRVRGNLDSEALEVSFRTMISRHEVLRTVIREENGIGYQMVMPVGDWKMRYAHAGDIVSAGSTPEQYLKAILTEPFDLSGDPMIRVALIRVAPQEHLLFGVIHHIAADGWSLPIIINELKELYSAGTEQRNDVLSPLPVQYADFALWQRNKLSGERLASLIAYWTDKLKEAGSSALPPDAKGPLAESRGGCRQIDRMNPALMEEMTGLARQQSVTNFMILLSAFYALLYRYMGVEDICIGSPVAGRQQQELEGLIGFFVNTLVFRVQLSGKMTFRELLAEVKRTVIEGYEHQELPFEKLVDALGIARNADEHPVFQTLFTFREEAPEDRLFLKGLEMEKMDPAETTAKFPIHLEIGRNADGLHATILYRTDLYREDSIRGMLSHYEQLLRSALSDAGKAIGELSLLSVEEEAQLLSGFNSAPVAYPQDKTMAALFGQQAALTPEATAVFCRDDRLTYLQLNEKANRLAHYLRRSGVGSSDRVLLVLNRGIPLLTAILATWKAGAAYVPLEPDLPAGRIAYILENAVPAVVLTDSASGNNLRRITGTVPLIELDSQDREISACSGDNPGEAGSAGGLAYVIYTSGSTGRPKGVMITHANLVDYVYGLKARLGIDRFRSFALLSTFAADLGNTVTFSSILSGGALHILTEEAVKDAGFVHDYFQEHAIDCVKIVPSLWKALSAERRPLLPTGMLIFGGEVLKPDILERIKTAGNSCILVNHYGPTETTIGKLLYIVDREAVYGESIPVGKPFSNTRVWVLSGDRSLCPIGVPGELHIEGDGVAEGYIGDAELTGKKFITSPFTGKKMYRTGDRVKYTPDGDILFLGRIDHQVKIRGYRIECTEIEEVLAAEGSTRQCLVAAREDGRGHLQLIAFIVPGQGWDKTAARAWLQTQLPEYMIPSQFIEVEEMPLTTNGKIDRQKLLTLDVGNPASASYKPPVTPAERQIAAVWQDFFGRQQIGMNDNFFELGGDSIVTIQMVSRIRKLGYPLTPKDIFLYQTVGRLAPVISARRTGVSTGEQGELSGSCGLLPIQEWFFARKPPVVSHYNQHLLLGISKSLALESVEKALAALLRQHDSLRLVFTQTAQGWTQHYGEEKGTLAVEDLRTAAMDDLQSAAAGDLAMAIASVADRHQQSLDIEKGQLVRAVLLLTPEQERDNRLLLVIHHLAVDGVSWRILLEDLEELLSGRKAKAEDRLTQKGNSYRQWHDSLIRYAGGKRLPGQIPYWCAVMRKYRPLPVDRDRDVPCRMGDTARQTTRLSGSLTRVLLQEVSRVYNTEMNDLLLSALVQTLTRWSGEDDIVIGLEGHGRESIVEGIDISRTVGWFTSLYPVALTSRPTADELLKSVKEQLHAVPDKGIGYGVLKYLLKEPALQDADQWDIVFNYLGQTDNIIINSALLAPAKEAAGQPIGDEITRQNKLEIVAIVEQGELVVNWSYSRQHYQEATVAGLAGQYMEDLEKLIRWCSAEKAEGRTHLTPSDHGLGGDVSYKELDAFLAEEVIGLRRGDRIESLYRLTGLQEGLLFHGLYDGKKSAYVQQMTCRLTGLNESVFIDSWKYLLRHHSILRSGFYHESFRVPVQCVFRDVQLPIQILDCRDWDAAQTALRIKEQEEEERNRGFDLTTPPLMRVSLFRRSEEEVEVIWTSHHLLFDGWSRAILMKELLDIYDGLLSKEEMEDKQEDRFEDHLRYMAAQDRDREEPFWSQYLQGLEQGTFLPFVTGESERTKDFDACREEVVTLNTQMTTAMYDYCRQQRITVNTLFQGVWAFLLHQYTGNSHIAYGVTVSGRPEELPEVESRVGLYINTLPLHSHFDKEKNAGAWLQGIQQEQLQSRSFQYSSLADIQRWAGITGDLFDTILVFENYPLPEIMANRAVYADKIRVFEQTNYPLTIQVTESEETRISFRYNERIADARYIRRIGAQFEQVLKEMIANTRIRLMDIDLLTQNEKEELLALGNAGAVANDFSLVEQLDHRLATGGGGRAVEYKDRLLSYADLDLLCGNLLVWFQSVRGLRKGDRVVVLLDRSEWIPITLFSLLKGGYVYVPVDTGNPWERIRFILEDINPALVIAGNGMLPDLAAMSWPVVTPTALSALLQDIGKAPVEVSLLPADPAYIIYTSGSTGKPKGVIVSHGNLDHFFGHVHRSFPCEAPVVMPFVASHGFDISLFQLLKPILAGGSILIVDKDQLQDLDQLTGLLVKSTVIDTVPGLYRLLINHLEAEGMEAAFSHIRQIYIGGDLIPDGMLYRLTRIFRRAQIIVMYGPTEATIVCTQLLYEPEQVHPDSRGVLIGRPITAASIYIMDGQTHLLPEGVEGEICIGGKGIAAGYLNRPELMAEKFITDPFVPGGRIYRTGDMGRWTKEGLLEFRGRRDDQVKIRGFRIELGEIESCLKSHENIVDAIVTVVTGAEGEKALAAYYVQRQGAESAAAGAELSHELRTHVMARLPWYMVPAYFLALEEIPLTGNGKVDRKALPGVERLSPAGSYEAPRTAGERCLAEVWQELLGVERIGLHANFFELGGDSIITIQVVSRMRRRGYGLSPKDLFVHQTIARLSPVLSTLGGVQSGGEQGQLEGVCGLLPVQRRYLATVTGAGADLSQRVLLKIKKEVSETLLSPVIGELVRRHDGLRFVYSRTPQGWEQRYGTAEGRLQVEDLRAMPEGAEWRAAIGQVARRCEQRLDIGAGHLVQAVLLLTPQHEQDNRLLLVVHHLAVDGVSWRILLEDLETALADSRHRESSRQAGGVLSPKGSSVRQWYEALDTYSHSPRLLAQAGHWADVTERYQPLGLSGDGQGSRQQCSLRLDAELTRALLQEVPAVYHTEINDVLLTALTRTLCEDSGRKGIVIGLEGHGRESSVVAAAAAIEGTVGWFTSLYPVWLPWQEGGTGGLVAVKEALRQVPDKGIGYGVLRYMVGEERTQRQPRLQGQQDPWEVTFNYLGQTGRLAGSQGLLGLDTEQTGSPDTEAVDGAEENNRRGIEVNSLIMDGQLVMNWRGMAEDPKLLKQLAERYKTALSHLINRCLEQKAQDREHHTPSDYGLGGEVSFEELEAFLSAPEREGRRADRIEGLYRLSALQEGLLFHSLYAGEQGAYWQQLRYELRGLEEGPFLQSWERIIARHTILRSGFYYDVFPIPVQVVYRELRLPVEVTNLERQDKDLLPALLEGYAQQELSRGMNLEEGPLLRLKLLRLAPGHYRVIWTFHHLVLDGWSLPVLLEELLAYYTTLTKGETPVISPVDRYEDYIRFTEGQDKAAQEAYWRRYLSGLEGGSLLPFIPSTADRNKEVVAFRATEWVLDKEKSSRVSAYVQRHHLTNNTLIQGIWAYLLYRYTDKSRVVFGVTVSGRPEELAEVEDRVGLYINMLPLSTEVSEERRMVEWLTQLQQEQLESRRYQYVSLNKIQGWAGLGGELFDSMISFQNFPVSEALRKGSGSGLQVGQMELQEQLTNYPLGLRVTGGERLKLEFIYKDQLLPAREVERIRGHFERVLDQVIDGSDKRIGELQLLTEAEQKQLDGFNATAAEYPRDKTVVQLFEAQVTRTPAAIAVVYEGLEMSYAELDARSNQLGHYLRGRGVKEEVLVGVCLERSIELIIGILGILKAGGAYVPMDPAYPVERIGYMVEDTGMRLVVSSQLNRVLFEGNAGIEEVVVLDSTDAPWRSAAAGKLNSCLRPDQAAYVIYTSGSTGRPKGAIIEHRNVVRLFRTDLPLYDFGAEDVWTLFHSSAFDFSVWEMYGALLFGGRLVIVPVETTRDADRFAGLLTREGVTVLNLTPSAFYAFEEKLTELTEGLKVRFLIFGGEALSPVKLRTWKQRYAGCRIVNMYGITETTVHVTYKEIGWEEIENGASNIGRPIPTLSCYVLAANGQPAPVGVPGELYVGGAGVARGYLNRPELTAQRFIPDPFGQAGGKLYRSGDLARWLPDGNLVYLGRIDHQVKIRGYRIELGEIETVLQKAPGVAQAVVVVRDELQGQKQLIGYFVPGEDRDKTDILSFLGARLPDHMLPSMLIELNEMPLTPNGKVDKKKLPAPAEASLSLKNRYAAPESEIERELCAIWQELLRIERIGIYDNFFELGGNSLLAIRLISYIKKKLTLTISIHSIFQFACISDLGKYIEVESNAGKQEAPAGSYDILNI